MIQLTELDKIDMCNAYKNGESILSIYSRYHIGERRLKRILLDNGIEIFDSHAKTVSNDDYIEKNLLRFPHHDGYKYVAISKNDNSIIYDDYLNKSGTLIAYIKNELHIEVPSLFKRKKFFHENGKQWYETYFDIIEVRLNSNVKKCPYCDWSTKDIDNNSGVFETHLLKEHGITKSEYLIEFPEDKEYFSLRNKTLNRQFETDENKFVKCEICGCKYARLDWRHLSKHGLTKKEYVLKYGENTVSNETKDKLSKTAILTNQNMDFTRISEAEKELISFIEENGLKCINSERKILNGKEIDIYIPDLKIGIEYNGNFWHKSDLISKNKHLEKLNECNKNGVKLIQIFEDEYVNSKDIVYNKLIHILKIEKHLPKIMGRKCTIKEIDHKSAETFLNKYHIQGFVRSTTYLGAFYGDELISVMSFKQENKNSLKWELNRFASNYNYICQGVGGKLFKYFTNNYNFSEIKSFADRRWTINENENVYTKLGFKFEKYTLPDYKYYNNKIDKYKRFHKFGFRKQILHKKYNLPLSMTEDKMTETLGYSKIYDCGLIKYIYKHR